MFLNTFVMTFAPARSNAFALSYSQLVPGNTGMNTVGCADLVVCRSQMLVCLKYFVLNFIPVFTPALGREYILKSLQSHVFNASSMRDGDIAVLEGCLVGNLTDHTCSGSESSPTLSVRNLADDIAPCRRKESLSDPRYARSSRLSWLPKAILLTASASAAAPLRHKRK